ncbi:MAG TPA: DUF6095 family protein [Flavobacteriaceae bacterium]|nr:DUF6095 family protein [Flavobacteriaceae bacterium]
METKHTDKKLLVSGIKTMFLSLICMFLGPTGIYIAFGNQEKSFYYPLLIVSVLVMGFAIYFAFKGISTILDSMFK